MTEKAISVIIVPNGFL